MKEYRVTEKQLDQIRNMLDYMREASQEIADGGGINIEIFERGMTALNEKCRELAYLAEDIENQPVRVQWIGDVAEFRRRFGLSTPAQTMRELRTQYKCVREEFFELERAFDDYRDGVIDAPLKVLDAICDLLYTTIGLGLGLGYDLEGAFAEVQRSNMTKLGADGKPIYRADGKVLKGPNYEPPRLTRFLAAKEVRDIDV